jgi:hypothetical protein
MVKTMTPDKIIIEFDRALRTVFASARTLASGVMWLA